MPRAGLTPAGVVDAALGLVDESGADALTLAAVAARVRVSTPSLYKHVAGLAELRALVGARVLDALADRLAEAVLGRSGDAAVRALMTAYRGYALDHPNRYAAVPQRPAAHPEARRAGDRVVAVFLAVLRAYDLDGPDAVHATRGLRAAAHGFVSLEITGGFGLPENVDDSYRRLVDSLLAGLRTPAPR